MINFLPKVYIATLYVGENDFEACKNSVKEQTYKQITHEIISYLPNKEAHDELYSRFMSLQNEYDYFIKLDADMVLINNSVIEDIVNIFVNNPEINHSVFSVKDCYSNTHIMGMHVYTNKVRWKKNRENLFVDTDPVYEGIKKFFWDNPAPVACHAPNPSNIEAFLFGYHRALKVVQRGNFKKIIFQSKFQFDLLHDVWEELLENKDEKHLAVILGAETVFKGNVQFLNDKSKFSFNSLDVLDPNKINIEKFIKVNEKYWNRQSIYYKLRKIRFISAHRFLLNVFKKLKRMVFSR